MGAVLLATKPSGLAIWRDALLAVDPGLEIRLWPDWGREEEIEVAVIWGAAYLEELHRFPRLRLIVSMGAGVDHLIQQKGPPPGVPVARLKDRMLTQGMAEWVLLNVLRFHRQDPEYRALQSAGVWEELPPPVTAERRIGILGLGEIGTATAHVLAGLGFPVMGWSRSPKALPGIETFHGDGLDDMLARTDILVCLLPLTPQTRGILNARNLALMPQGGWLINGGRGGHQVQEDILAALDAGQLAGAALDVFEPEPLPADHAFWTHPKLWMTPHAASFTIPSSAAPQVVDNIHRLRDGQPLINLVDFAAGY